jgi:hypothetical protein
MRISTPCTTSSKAPSTEMKIRILEEIQGVKNVYEILLKVALNTINPKIHIIFRTKRNKEKRIDVCFRLYTWRPAL